jgi:hypothetical protein
MQESWKTLSTWGKTKRIFAIKDFNTISNNAGEFAEKFTKENGYKPKIVLSLCSLSKNSNRLMRQIKDSAVGWEVEIHADICN